MRNLNPKQDCNYVAKIGDFAHFMVRIIKQPTWIFKRYQEVYDFDVALATEPLIEKILTFYAMRNVRDVVCEGAAVRFSAGSTIGSLLSPFEQHHKREATIRVTLCDGQATVNCDFSCWRPYPGYLIAPHPLQKEIEQLEVFCSRL